MFLYADLIVEDLQMQIRRFISGLGYHQAPPNNQQAKTGKLTIH
jgi:hypothetical protein